MNPNDLVALSNIRTDMGDLDELRSSIAAAGIQIPIIYYRVGDLNVVKDGHRRLKCVQQINADAPVITDVPVIEVPAPDNEDELALFQLVAAKDGLRKPLNPIEEARAIESLLINRSGKEVAEVLGKSTSYVSRRHRLVGLHPDFQAAVISGKLDVRVAEQLLTLSPEAAADPVLRKSLIAAKTVRAVKTKVVAANAATQAVQEGEGPEIDIDPLLIALREEAKLKVTAATSALKELEAVYRMVDEKPSLASVREAMNWITW